jgi:3-oxoacyl-[acyl-carrier protein] reductase
VHIDLSSRTAVVTGAGQGIGAAIARGLAACGAHIVVADRNADGASRTARELADASFSAEAVTVDVAEEDAVAALFARLRESGRGCDILVNNAGISKPGATEQTPLDQWEAVFRVNTTGPFLCAKHAVAGMRERGWGRIVNIASFAAKSAPIYADNASYAASKAAVVGLTHNLAVEYAAHGVTVNAVAPGVIDSALLRSAHTPERRAELVGRIPAGRFTTAEEVAAAVTFLASEQASAIVGETLSVNGGMYLD